LCTEIGGIAVASKIRNKWTVRALAIGLTLAIVNLLMYLWGGLTRGRWHWWWIAMDAFWIFFLYPGLLSKELRRPKELIPGAPDPNEPNLSLFQ
jgi:hypothetical protein